MQSAPVAEDARRRRLRVVVDGLSNRVGGGRRYLQSLLEGMAGQAADELDVLIALPDATDRIQIPARFDAHVVRGVNELPRRLAWIQFGLPRLATRWGADVIFAPGNIGPLQGRTPVVLMLQVTPEAAGFARKRVARRLWWAAMTEASRRTAVHARRVLTGTEHLKSWIVQNWGLSPEKVEAIPYGVAAPFARGKPVEHAGHPFILYAGDYEPHKNLVCLVDAFSTVAALHPSLRLLFAGDLRGSSLPAVRAAIARHALVDRVELLGRIEAARLAELYQSAELVVMPSLAESFGLPVLEAMACGAAVIAAGIPALREVGSDAALYFEPQSAIHLAARMQEVLHDRPLRQRLRQAGLAHAERFTWRRTAERTTAALREVVQSPTRSLPISA